MQTGPLRATSTGEQVHTSILNETGGLQLPVGEATNELRFLNPGLSDLRPILGMFRDHTRAGYDHCRRVAVLAAHMTIHAGIEEDQVELAYLGGLFHDIGYLTLPKSAFDRLDDLSDREQSVVLSHPRASCEIVRTCVSDPRLHEVILNHHEQPNGRGTPNGVRLDDLVSGIVAVATSYDDMVYNPDATKALSVRATIDEIQEQAGSRYLGRAARLLREAFG